MIVAVSIGGCGLLSSVRGCDLTGPDSVIFPLPPGATQVADEKWVSHGMGERYVHVVASGRSQDQLLLDLRGWYEARGWTFTETHLQPPRVPGTDDIAYTAADGRSTLGISRPSLGDDVVISWNVTADGFCADGF